MHATELKRDYVTRYCLFAIDSEDYLEMLPTASKVGSGDMIKSTTCCAGSLARCQDGTTYVLNGNDEWVELQSGGGGGGGEDIDDITNEDIHNLFD